MLQGKVKFYNQEKGFGFLVDNDSGKEVFIHRSSLVGTSTLDKNEDVNYEMGEGRRGEMAVNVTRAN